MQSVIGIKEMNANVTMTVKITTSVVSMAAEKTAQKFQVKNTVNFIIYYLC